MSLTERLESCTETRRVEQKRPPSLGEDPNWIIEVDKIESAAPRRRTRSALRAAFEWSPQTAHTSCSIIELGQGPLNHVPPPRGGQHLPARRHFLFTLKSECVR